MWVQLSTTCSNVLKQPNGELLVAVYHNQLRTMASETVDPIFRSHPPPSWAVSPERHVHSINQCNLSGTRTCNRSMRGNHLACAATQGIIQVIDGVGPVDGIWELLWPCGWDMRITVSLCMGYENYCGHMDGIWELLWPYGWDMRITVALSMGYENYCGPMDGIRYVCQRALHFDSYNQSFL